MVAAITSNLVQNPNMSVPSIIWLSSSSLSHDLEVDAPAPVKYLVHTAFSNAYADLAHAEKYLSLHSAWLPVVYIRPGGLVDGEAKGYKISLKRQEGGFISYPDLGAGMVEVAQSEGLAGKEVAINSASNEANFEWTNVHRMPRGLLWHFAPWSYRLSRSIGLVS